MVRLGLLEWSKRNDRSTPSFDMIREDVLANNTRILDLLADWEVAHAEGEEPTPESLCPDDPELREELRQRIERRRGRLSPILGNADTLKQDEPDAPPPELPGYEIQSELGRGGMGVVYLARQTALGRLVALKVLRPGLMHDPEWARRFRREAEAVARCPHPSIVQVFDFGTESGRAFVALEYVPGKSLAKQLNGEPQSPTTAAQLVESTARAVAAVHRSGVIHRDLKPGNILVVPDGSPKVTDFGLARKIDDADGLTRTGAVFGTPSYMSPEQATGQVVGPLTDVYALGAILYECLVGRPPFRGASSLDTLLLVKTQDPISPRQLVPSIPRSLEAISLKCLEKSPDRRYASADALADDLQRFLRGETVMARPLNRVERAWRWCRRHPREASLLTIIAMVLVVGLVVSNRYRLKAESSASVAIVEADRATANLGEALVALEKVVQRAESDTRRYGGKGANRPAFVPSAADQKELIDLAIATYEKLVQKNSQSAFARYQAARAWMNLRAAYRLLNDGPKALDATKRAVELLQQLVFDEDTNRQYKTTLARALDEYGSEHVMSNVATGPDDGVKNYVESIRLWKQLQQEEPTNPEAIAGLAEANYHMAEHFEFRINKASRPIQKGKQPTETVSATLIAEWKREATEAFQEADRLLQMLFELGPVSNAHRGLTARVCDSMADFYLFKLGRNPLPLWTKAISVLDPVILSPDLEFRFRDEYLFAVVNLKMNLRSSIGPAGERSVPVVGHFATNGIKTLMMESLLRKSLPVAEQVAGETFPNLFSLGRVQNLFTNLGDTVSHRDPQGAADQYEHALRWAYRQQAVSSPTAPINFGLVSLHSRRVGCMIRAGNRELSYFDWETAASILYRFAASPTLNEADRLQIVREANDLRLVLNNVSPGSQSPPIDNDRISRITRLASVSKAIDCEKIPAADRKVVADFWEARLNVCRSTNQWAEAADAGEQADRFLGKTLSDAERLHRQARRAFDLRFAGQNQRTFDEAERLGKLPQIATDDLFSLLIICGQIGGDPRSGPELQAKSANLGLEYVNKYLSRSDANKVLAGAIKTRPDLTPIRQLPGFVEASRRIDQFKVGPK